MDPNPIVTKAVQLAISNGWRKDEFRDDKRFTWPPKTIRLVEDRDYYANTGWWVESNEYRSLYAQVCQSDDYEDLIYNHDFAKALWGENKIATMGLHTVFNNLPAWAFHLTQMVIADDPIAYLGDHL